MHWWLLGTGFQVMSLVQTVVIPEDGEKPSSHWKKMVVSSVRLEGILMLPFRGGTGEEHSTKTYVSLYSTIITNSVSDAVDFWWYDPFSILTTFYCEYLITLILTRLSPPAGLVV